MGPGVWAASFERVLLISMVSFTPSKSGSFATSDAASDKKSKNSNRCCSRSRYRLVWIGLKAYFVHNHKDMLDRNRTFSWFIKEFFFIQIKTYYSLNVRFNPHKVKFNQILEPQTSALGGGYLWWSSLISFHIIDHLRCQPLGENGRNKNRDFVTKFAIRLSIFNLNMSWIVLHCSYYH